ncbi:MAG: Ig-like domain-containing protein [Holophagales bacterium]|nr:Ig-like domain-containing protein [Holophagales bacterium]
MFSGSRFASVLSGFARVALLLGLLLLAAPGFSQGLPNDQRLSISLNGAPKVRSGASSSTVQLIATISPSNATDQGIQWSSNNPSVASVDSTGFVTAHSPGTTIITATTTDGTFISASCIVTVKRAVVPVSGVTLSKNSLSMARGSQQQLMATVAPANATNRRVAWSSSKPNIATVGAFGLVTAKASGTATITATTQDGDFVSSSVVTVRSVSSSIGEWASVSAGNTHSLGIKSDGTLWAWGANYHGNLGYGNTDTKKCMTRVGTASDWSKIWAGDSHSLGIKTDGSLWSWGCNDSGQLGLGDTKDKYVPTRIGTDTDWVALSGNGSGFALKSNGTLWAWGDNSYGKLGIGDNVNRLVPIQVGTDEDWAAVSSSSNCSYALKYDGSLWAWGRNESGQLGLGDSLDRNNPTRVGMDTDWAAISASTSSCRALKSNGTLWAWGNNANGYLGLGDNLKRDVPTQIGVADDWTTVATGVSSTLAFKTDGSLWGWGPLSGSSNQNVPIKIGTDTDWAAASVSSHVLAIKTDGSLWVWGLNNYLQLGDESYVSNLTPVPGIMPVMSVNLNLASATINLGDIKQLTATVYPSNATNKEVVWSTSDANVVTVNQEGLVTAMGNGTAIVTATTMDGAFAAACNVVVKVSVEGNATVKIAAGAWHSMVIKSDGSLWASGVNSNGQLGLGDRVNRNVITRVGMNTDWAAIAAFTHFTVAIKSDGSLWAWGSNSSNQLGLGHSTDMDMPTRVGIDTDWASVTVGLFHAFAIKSNGTLWAWGLNNTGQLGLGDRTDRSVPTRVGIDSDWASVVAGSGATFAIKIDGSLWAWGSGAAGNLGFGNEWDVDVPTRVGLDSDWASVTVGYYHTFAKKTDGSLWTCGYNPYRQLGMGSGISKITVFTRLGIDTDWASVVAGHNSTFAIKKDGSLYAWGYNYYGTLGLGDTIDKDVPIRVGMDCDWASVMCGESQTFAFKLDGSLWVWGNNEKGQLGLGDFVSRRVPTRMGIDTDWGM